MADLALPTAFCRSPLASCTLPSPLSAGSSVASPTPCFTLPATWFAVPLTLSDVLLIAFSLEVSQLNAPATSPLPPGIAKKDPPLGNDGRQLERQSRPIGRGVVVLVDLAAVVRRPAEVLAHVVGRRVLEHPLVKVYDVAAFVLVIPKRRPRQRMILLADA